MKQWKADWRFVRQHWPQIDCGDLWGRLTAAQKRAAIALHERNHQLHHQTPADKLALPF
ncbi:MAG TPA: hypothetical protein VJ652_16420 [Noviherbaspirillum sp.]|nr:hypothetical protein [Noviherbaspirillum sp.]